MWEDPGGKIPKFHCRPRPVSPHGRPDPRARRKRLEGVVAADRNMANARQQTLLEAKGISAQFMAQDASLSWVNEGAVAASAGLNIAGSVLGGATSLMDMDWGGSTKEKSVYRDSATYGAPGSGVLRSEFVSSPLENFDLGGPLKFNNKPGPWRR